MAISPHFATAAYPTYGAGIPPGFDPQMTSALVKPKLAQSYILNCAFSKCLVIAEHWRGHLQSRIRPDDDRDLSYFQLSGG